MAEPVALDMVASVEAMTRQYADGAIKISEDLDRYRAVIANSQPEVVIECGTWHGGSALWFADQGLDVVTIDIAPGLIADEVWNHPRISCLIGDSVGDDAIAESVGIAGGRRIMVVLDSDHSAEHVRNEIDAYGPLVSVGCHLVVEDGVVGWIPSPFDARIPGPLDAIEATLVGNPLWRRDTDIEDMHPVTMYPMGWWQRNPNDWKQHA